MEKNSKPIKKFVKRKRSPPKKFKCELCEKMVVKNRDIITRKNYPYGKKSKAQVTVIHRVDGGCLVELKRKRK